MDSIYSQQFMEGNIEAPNDIAQEQADILVHYMKKGAEPFLTTLKLGATASVQFCSTVPLSNITTNNTNTILVNVGGSTTYTCYPFKGIVTVVSQ